MFKFWYFTSGILIATLVFVILIWMKIPEYNVGEVGSIINECQSKITREQKCILVAIPEPEVEMEIVE